MPFFYSAKFSCRISAVLACLDGLALYITHFPMNSYPLNTLIRLILSCLALFDWCGVNSCLIKSTSYHIQSRCGGSWRGEEMPTWWAWISLHSGALNSTVTAAPVPSLWPGAAARHPPHHRMSSITWNVRSHIIVCHRAHSFCEGLF